MLVSVCLVSTFVIHVVGFILETQTRTVSTPVGDITGTISEVKINSSFSCKIERYRGIPYAEAPTGHMRFRKPIPKATFKVSFDATKEGPDCFQYVVPELIQKLTMSEDCLRLNIYVPRDSSTFLKPVMIWIHGGGFIFGSSNGFDASVLSTYGDVIVVTINYRLAQYGFLSSGDKELPGNLGLWDQHLAIKWVHDNIHAFGGDINRVTVFGESAGSASVVFQTFYPGNIGLFQHAIAESGTISSFWAHTSLSNARSVFSDFVMATDCNTSSTPLPCLRFLPIDKLNATVNSHLIESVVPVVDAEFVLDEPIKLITGETSATAALEMFFSVDLITGINNADGLLNVNQWLKWTNSTDKNNFTISKENFTERAVKTYMENYFRTTVPRQALLEAAHVYTNWKKPHDSTERMKKLVDIATDVYFTLQTVKTASLHAHGNKNTFVYEFSTRPLQHDRWVPTCLDGPTIANHGDEIAYVFGMNFEYTTENVTLTKQYQTYKAMMTMWSNFAKTG